MKKFDVLIFDLDNTLIDFSHSETIALPIALESFDIQCKEQDIKEYQKISRTCWVNMEKGLFTKERCVVLRFEQFLEYLGIDNINASDLNKKYLEALSTAVPLMEGTEEVLKKVKGDYVLVMMTNGVKWVQESKIKKSGLDEFFDHIIISDDAGHNKPDIRIYEYMENLIGKFDKDKMLMIGDSVGSDIEGGINYGIKTCFFNPKGLDCEVDVDYDIRKMIEVLEVLK